MRLLFIPVFLLLGSAAAGAQQYALFLDFALGKSCLYSDMPGSPEYFPNQLEDGNPSAVSAEMKIGMEVFSNLGLYFSYGGWMRDFEFESVPRFGRGASVNMRHMGGGVRYLLPVARHWSVLASAGGARYYGEIDPLLSDPPDPGPLGSETGFWEFGNAGYNLSGGFVYLDDRNGGAFLAGLETGFHRVDIELSDDETGETSTPQTTTIPQIRAYIGFGLDL